MTQTDRDFFRTLIENRREGFLEWLAAASREDSDNGAHLVVLNRLERALNRIRSEEFGTCAECEGNLEPEVLGFGSDRDLCLDCMNEEQKRQLENDLRVTQEVNRSMLPRLVPNLESWDIGILYRPTRLLSGDFYDIIPRPGNSLALAVGDVAGKGIPAGLLRASLQATLRTLSDQSMSPAKLMGEANRHFLAASHPSRFASAFYGVLQKDRGALTYANGGHLPPMLRRRSGDWEILGATGTVLGILEESCFQERTCTIGSGDVLILFTDGITETEGPSGEFFDERRLVEAVERRVGSGAQAIADAVADELDRFSLRPPTDDRTLVVLHRLPGD